MRCRLMTANVASRDLRALTDELADMRNRRFRSARNYLPTSSFRSKPRFDDAVRRSTDGAMQTYQFVNDRGAWISSTKRELKFPLQVCWLFCCLVGCRENCFTLEGRWGWLVAGGIVIARACVRAL